MPLSVPISNNNPTDAFYEQFSAIIRYESRLRGNYSEGITGPARRRWVVMHLAEVAHAQGYRSQVPSQATTWNVHAQEFTTPLSAQTATSTRYGNTGPWYNNFNLADQGVVNTSGPYRPPRSSLIANQRATYPPNAYRPFDPAELAAYRDLVQAQLAVQQSFRPYETSVHNVNSNTNHQTINHPRVRIPSTPPSRVRYPSTPPNRPARYARQPSPTDSVPSLVASTTTLRANTEPIAQSARMSSLTAPDHYEPFEVYALEVRNGDFIQSVKYPGEVLSHYPINAHDHLPLSAHDARPVNPNGDLRIQFKGADGTIRASVFQGLEKVMVLRRGEGEVGGEGEGDGEKEVKGEGKEEGEGDGKEEGL